MKLSVYVPKDLEEPLEEQAARAGTSPSLFIQSLLKRWFEAKPRRFSQAFLDLAGSWEDERSTEEIIRDIEESRRSTDRPVIE